MARKRIHGTGSSADLGAAQPAATHVPAPLRTPVPAGAEGGSNQVRRVGEPQKGDLGPSGGSTIRRVGTASGVPTIADWDEPTRARRGDNDDHGARPRRDDNDARGRSNAMMETGTRSRRDALHGQEETTRLGDHFVESSKARNLLGVAQDDGYVGTPMGKLIPASDKDKRDHVRSIKAAEKEKAPHQPVADLAEIFTHCSMLEAEFKFQVETIGKWTKGRPEFRPDGKMKSIGRSLQKMVKDYGGDASRLIDLTGGSLAFKSAEDLIIGYGMVASNRMFNVVRVKNSLAKGEDYGDINMTLEMGSADYTVVVDGEKRKEHHDGFLIELQLHLDPIIKAKAAAHKPYERQRRIGAKYGGATKPGESWDADDTKNWKDLAQKMSEIYGPAWDQVGDKAAVAAQLKAAIPALNPK